MNNLGFSEEMEKKIKRTEEKIQKKRLEIQEIALFNQQKVLQAFARQKVAATDFLASNGYGYDDLGREKLDAIYAECFGCESALVRPQIVSGTHAIAIALFGVLRPGDHLLYATGAPYDTMLEVVGLEGSGNGSFKEFGIEFDFAPLDAWGKVDFEELKKRMRPNTKVVVIQRSRGYSERESFTISQIQEMCEKIRAISKEVLIFADNCYGEFSQTREPTQVGVDFMAGSLIKNPGGGVAKTGGYIAGRRDLVESASYRLTVPGVGGHGGAMGTNLYDFFQGIFMAPHIVSQAIQGAIFTAGLLEEFSVPSTPNWAAPRTDLIQTISLQTEEAMVRFCQSIQRFSPIDAHLKPIASPMPGYADPIIMASGAFVEGSTLEFSADGPVRAPYNVFLQGGLTYEHVKIAVSHAVEEVFVHGSTPSL